jgi:ribosomal-protein-alanine N-acetyltransferase
MIRKLEVEDLPVLNELIHEIDTKDITECDIVNNPFNKYFVYCDNDQIVGFISYAVIYDRSELNYIVVKNECRSEGIASNLMQFMINDCCNSNCINITLEVMENNIKAINLYCKYGFKKTAVRKNYYGDIDGIMMERVLVNK